MGSINLIPFLGANYVLFVPTLTGLVCLVVLLRLDRRLMAMLGLQGLFYYQTHASDATHAENIEDGRALIRREKSRNARVPTREGWIPL